MIMIIIIGTSHEDLCTFIICRYILVRMRNVSDIRYKDIQNTHFNFNKCFSKIVPFIMYCGKIW